MNLYKYKYFANNLKNKVNINSQTFIYLLITLSSYKIFGYVFGFLFLAPFVYFNFNHFVSYLKNSNFEEKLVSYYFLYLIIQSFIGAYTLKDIRIVIFWVTFFIISIFTYFYNNYLIKNNKLFRENYFDLIFNSTIIYFFFLLVMNFISINVFQNPWDIQNNFWVGGSTSFSLSSLFLYCLFKKWSDLNFRLNTIYTFLISFYIFLVLLNESRLGQLYLLLFILFVILKAFSIKKIINGFLISILCFYIFSIGSSLIYKFSFINNSYYTTKTLLKEAYITIYGMSSAQEHFEDKNYTFDGGRIQELSFGIENFKESNLIEKIFGKGWYSSRISIGTTRNRIIDELDLEKKGFVKSKVNQLQGIISLLLDTGLFGLIYSSILFLILLRKILFLKSLLINKLFYLCLIFTNILSLFTGYPWISIPYILILMPRGIFLLEKNKN